MDSCYVIVANIITSSSITIITYVHSYSRYLHVEGDALGKFCDFMVLNTYKNYCSGKICAYIARFRWAILVTITIKFLLLLSDQTENVILRTPFPPMQTVFQCTRSNCKV